jgi:hypothetical protein
LLGGGEVKGRIERADDAGFTITEDKTGKRSDLAYTEVAEVKGRGMSTSTKLLIIGAVAVGVIAILAVVAIKTFDPFGDGLFRP